MSTIAAAPGLGARASVRRPAPAAVRLTRRGRLVLLAALLALVFAALTVFGGESAATSEKGSPVETRTVEVGAGDTLWEIAADVAEPGEIRQMVYRIEELNALDGSALAVGQELAVPVS